MALPSWPLCRPIAPYVRRACCLYANRSYAQPARNGGLPRAHLRRASKAVRACGNHQQKAAAKAAATRREQTAQAVERFLDALSLKKRLKGRAYAAWLLRLMVPSPMLEDSRYASSIRHARRQFHTTPASVERALRVAVESVFTQGSMRGIERFFGATVDPERGKPTNRAFLLQAAQQLRYSLTTACSANSSEMHHSPAAPTMV